MSASCQAMPTETLHIQFDCSAMKEFVHAAAYAIASGELSSEEALQTLAEFVIIVPEVRKKPS